MEKRFLRTRDRAWVILFLLVSPWLICAVFANEPNEGWTYKTHQHETLSEISIRLYGTHRMWPEIAKWNSIKAPFSVRPNQVLTLKTKPTVKPEEGERFVQNLWRAYFDLPPQGTQLNTPEIEPSPIPKTRAQQQAEIKDQFLAAVQETESREAVEKTAEEYLSQGETLLKNGQFEKAVESFQKSREIDSSLTAPWLLEIRALRLLKREDEARRTSVLFLKLHPELRSLPLFKDLLGDFRGNP